MMRIADVIMEMQQKPIENVMVAVVEMPSGLTARRLRAVLQEARPMNMTGALPYSARTFLR